MYSSTADELLTPHEAADLLRTTPATLANMRYAGTGPHFVKDGRRVLYKRSGIDAYVNANTFERTDKRVIL